MQIPPVLDPDDARRAIADLDGLSLESASVDELKERLTPLFTGYRTFMRTFQRGMSLYRAVKWTQRPEHMKKLSHAPKEFVGMSRANRANRPLFYGALAARNASLFELRLVPGDTVAIGRWETSNPIRVAQLGHVDPVFRELDAFRKPYFKIEERDPGSGIVDQWLSARFCDRVGQGADHAYKLTTAIAEKYLDSELFDGVLYPSIETRANADNIALKPTIADSNLRLETAEFARVESVRNGVIELLSLDFAREVDSDGNILWLGAHSPPWRLPGVQRFWRVHWTRGGWSVVEWRPVGFEPC